MALISHNIPNLVGGISQQAPSQRADNQLEDATNCILHLTKGAIKRPGTEFVKLLKTYSGNKPFYTAFRVDDVRYHFFIFNENGTNDFVVMTDDGTELPIEIPYYATSMYMTGTSPALDYVTTDIMGQLIIANKNIVVQKGGNKTGTWNKQGLAFISGANYNTTYSITVTKGTASKTISFTTMSATQDGVDWARLAERSTSVGYMLAHMYAKFNGSSSPADGNTGWDLTAVGLPSNMAVSYTGSCLHFYNINGDTTDFSISCTDSYGGSLFRSIKDSVESVEKLPNIAPVGFTIKVDGKNDQSVDDYYVISLGERWKETIGEDVTFGFDSATVPQTLTIAEDGSKFYLTPVSFSFRTVGDETTNPFPTFTGEKIKHLFYYQDRLGVLAGNSLVMSCSGAGGASEYNFFRTTTLTTLDTDTIDISVESPIVFAVPFAASLLIFSTTGQYKLTSNGPLTASTAVITTTTQFNVDTGCTPVGVGKYVYFGAQRGNNGALWEFAVESNASPLLATVDDAAEVSAHCPDLMPRIKRLCASTNNQIVIAEAPEGDADNMLYVYQYLWNNGQKMQSSWVKWEFSGNVYGMYMDDGDELFLIMEYDGILYFEKLNLNVDAAEIENGEFSVHLDRRVRFEDGFVELPYAPLGGIINFISNEGEILTRTEAETWDGVVWAGVPFNYRIEFSQFFPPMNDIKLVGGSLRMRRAHITYEDTCYFRCSKSTQEELFKEFNGIVLNDEITADTVARRSGVFKYQFSGKSTKVRLVISNPTPFPCQIIGVTWEGLFTYNAKLV